MTILDDILIAEASAAPDGRLTFARVMELALYHPEHGYYGPAPRRIGRAGDFFTAVSAGQLYGRLLAGLAERTWNEMGKPGEFCIIEQGAHDGQLAHDMLSACGLPLRIVEPNPRYQAAQHARLADFQDRVSWTDSLDELPPCPALFVCNELPDAMPEHLLRFESGEWRELHVAWEGGRAIFKSGPLSSGRLRGEAARLPVNLPEGHMMEIGLAALDWMEALARSAIHGRIFIADYGLDEEEFFSPERAGGTLRRYHSHQSDDRVLEDLGRCDLTAHVNFTRLAETAASRGLSTLAYEHQGRFLGRLGMDWLRSLDGAPPDAATRALLRQYHTLTHPAFLGRTFRVLLLEKPHQLAS
ncbi:MAG TPA: hypothetical protein DIT13_08955 [Verrucomicrobiales bacterium]|nr:hypothetical protein [Verrucomicrobiales bacterium]HRJ08682.1 SAM-dependent methyltransferase [Prosthecobacter sp.]HRK14011.1 SAM-dependent methyltransferase [Prosthecobacter sp.]